MFKTKFMTYSLALCLLSLAPGLAQATSGWRNDWQTYYDPCQTLVDANCAACHTSAPALNVYGDDMLTYFDTGMTREEAFAAIEALDSDGDGYTNGQEIVVDCTFPWDAADHGTVAADHSSWDSIKALYQ